MNTLKTMHKARRLAIYATNTLGLEENHPVVAELEGATPYIAGDGPEDSKLWWHWYASRSPSNANWDNAEVIDLLNLEPKPRTLRNATIEQPANHAGNQLMFRVREELKVAFDNNRPAMFMTFTFADDWVRHAKELTTGKHRKRVHRQLHLIDKGSRWITRTEWGGKFQRPHMHAVWIGHGDMNKNWPWRLPPASTHAEINTAGQQLDECMTLPHSIDWLADDGLPVWPYGQIQVKPVRTSYTDWWARAGHRWPSNDEPMISDSNRIAMYVAKDLTKDGVTPEERPNGWDARTSYSCPEFGIDHRLRPMLQEMAFKELLAILRNYAIPKGLSADEQLLSSTPPRALLQREAWKEIYRRRLTKAQEKQAINVARHKACDVFGMHIIRLKANLNLEERTEQLADMALFMLGFDNPEIRKTMLADSLQYTLNCESIYAHAMSVAGEVAKRTHTAFDRHLLFKMVTGAIAAHAAKDKEFAHHLGDANSALHTLTATFPPLEIGGPAGNGVAGYIKPEFEQPAPPIYPRSDPRMLDQETFDFVSSSNQQTRPRNKKWLSYAS